MTTGEARVLTAVALNEPLDDVETFAVIGFVHRGHNDHDLVIVSNLCDTPPLLLTLMAMVTDTALSLDVTGSPLVDRQKMKRLVAHVRLPWWKWWLGNGR